MNYQDININADRVRQVSLSLAEDCIQSKTSIQLELGKILADKKVVIAMDGSRTRTRVYDPEKVGRTEKFETPWREPSFRFNKQDLFLDSYSCEDVQHLDNFFLVNQLANWLLYTAADDVQFIPRKWEMNKSAPIEKTEKLSIAKTRRSAEKLFLTFDKKPFLPKPAKKGKGHIKEKRLHFPVVRKPKKKP